MGCFTVLRGKKKISEEALKKPLTFNEGLLTTLPEPQTSGRSLQSAPSSFKERKKAIQPTKRVPSSRIRALSAPSSLHVCNDDPTSLAVFKYREEEIKGRTEIVKNHQLPKPLPLPLPSPQPTTILQNFGSFRHNYSSIPIVSGPLPLPPTGGLKNFSFREIAAACQQFSADSCISEGSSSMVYIASFGGESSSKKFEATVTRLLSSNQGLKEFVSKVHRIASLQHPRLCKLLGYHAYGSSDQRFLIYEKLFHGSLDRLLHGRSEGPFIDWGNRMKVAVCAAQGLAFLHEEGPFQAMYDNFSAANIQVDKDFGAKLSGYGCVSYNPDIEISDTSSIANLPVETLERGLLTPKSNVWSFGIVLLELLTGRKNMDSHLPKEERNLIRWSKPYLTDDCRLSLIIDSRLKGRFPPKAARVVSDIALRCLQKESSERPTMRAIAESLRDIRDMKYSCRFPLQKP